MINLRFPLALEENENTDSISVSFSNSRDVRLASDFINWGRQGEQASKSVPESWSKLKLKQAN
ncbi:hypothetical protein E2542_SST04137 [Spatholobus suberectus]|nr:hypothetical protein E2542_SST04137 [Spatholobus suberectus]